MRVPEPRLNYSFISEKASEADSTYEWKSFLRPFLGKSGNIRSRSGECVSKSSSTIQVELEDTVTGFGTQGRKADLLFVGGKHELSNFEFKSESAGSTKFRTQRLKNIRLNRAIVEGHYKIRGSRGHLFFMDFSVWKGVMNVLYTCKKAYRSANTLQMTTTDDLLKFLESESS
ncbi:hypothetical protein B0O80DRAFT_494656 [Mortierella sp. GBAus27b]|nr:hypothetical protein B0O80DRAFT_494656 [Mortierella sp. GBAus27b]